MWRRVEKLCDWQGPRAPDMRLLFNDVRATPAVLSFLRDTKVGKMISLEPQEERGEEGSGEDGEDGEEGEEGGPGPP